MSKRKLKGELIITIPNPLEIPLPPEFEKYVKLKAASDLLAVEAAKLLKKMMEIRKEQP